MTTADIDLIEVASTLLAGYALNIRMAHNVDPQAPDWKDEPDALAMHDQTKGTADALLDLADRMRGGVTAWTPISALLPDADLTVMLALDDGEVWPGYLDGDTWRYVTSDPIGARVTHWMDLPEGPK